MIKEALKHNVVNINNMIIRLKLFHEAWPPLSVRYSKSSTANLVNIILQMKFQFHFVWISLHLTIQIEQIAKRFPYKNVGSLLNF